MKLIIIIEAQAELNFSSSHKKKREILKILIEKISRFAVVYNIK